MNVFADVKGIAEKIGKSIVLSPGSLSGPFKATEKPKEEAWVDFHSKVHLPVVDPNLVAPRQVRTLLRRRDAG